MSLPVVGALLAATVVLQSGRPQAPRFSLQEGDEVPRLVGLDLAGRPISIDYTASTRPTVVYVITPFGHFVDRNEPAFAALVRQASGRYRFVLLAPNPAANKRLSEYVTKVRPQWGKAEVLIVRDITPELKEDMLLSAYPSTLVISPKARVLKNFQGAYTDDSLSAKPADLEGYFRVRLPRLKSS